MNPTIGQEYFCNLFIFIVSKYSVNVLFYTQNNMADYSSIGFIGLGAMGAPMVGHLANKLSPEISIHIFDVVQSIVEELVNQFPNSIYAEKTSKDVAEKSVRFLCTVDSIEVKLSS